MFSASIIKCFRIHQKHFYLTFETRKLQEKRPKHEQKSKRLP